MRDLSRVHTGSSSSLLGPTLRYNLVRKNPTTTTYNCIKKNEDSDSCKLVPFAFIPAGFVYYSLQCHMCAADGCHRCVCFCWSVTHRMPEPVECEVLLNGPLVEDNVDRDAP